MARLFSLVLMYITVWFLVCGAASAGQPPAADEELFERASELWDRKQDKQALQVFKELIKNYPTSKHVPDAYLAFGEYYFNQGNIEKALMAYKKVTAFKEAVVYPYAVYKSGWCYYNIHEFERALKHFLLVVKHCDREQKKTGIEPELRREALKDIALVYSHAKGAEHAPDFIKHVAPDEAGEWLAKLGSMYYGAGKYKDAAIVYRHLLAGMKCSPEMLVLQKRILDCTARLGARDKVVKEAGRLVALFGQIKKCLRETSESENEALSSVQAESEGILRKLAVSTRSEARATKDEKTLRHSRQLARYYLKLFSRHPQANVVRQVLY